jgi:8-oxo-dGTP pyrophosphatase MutT (NUDIX family)
MIKQETEKMTTKLIKTLINNLPRYAEEEGDFYAVKREDLINALCSEQVNQLVAENTVGLIENLLDSLAVLNGDYLAKGEWCFISFPAQLLALSVLTTMSDKDSRLLADNFWNTQGIDNDKKDKQRNLLNSIETNRVACHSSNNAPPIRYIYVAWSIIKLDDKVLFYQREDTHKRFDKSAGDYGLIGGRFNQRDMADFVQDKPRYLKMVQSNCSEIKTILPETLKRELQEEAGLIFDQHYTFSLWRELKPYRQVQGSAPNHAFTEYYLDIFHINLTLTGYIHLQNRIKTDDKLVWFSLDEIEKGETADGKCAYIKALFDDFNQDSAALKSALMAVSDSFNCPYQFKRDKYGLTLLQHTDKPLFAGVLGKEKVLPLVLTARQQAILLGLAAHNRGFEFAELAAGVVLHPAAWLEVRDVALQQELMALLAEFKSTNFVIEQQQERFFRLSVEPSLLYFDSLLFTYCVQQADLDSRKTKILVTIGRAAIVTAFGTTASKDEEFMITRRLAKDLHKLFLNKAGEEAKHIEDNYKNTKHFNVAGLKSLLCRTSGKISFDANYLVS